MKQKDIALIIVIAAISGALSLAVAHFVFLKPQDHQVKAEHVEPITTDFTQPDSKYFNAQSIDPTQQIQIGNDANQAPYKSTQL